MHESPAATLVLGHVEGETPGVALWLRLAAIVTDTKEFLAPKPERTILLKWEWMVFARLVKGPAEAEEIKKEIGFLPRSARRARR